MNNPRRPRAERVPSGYAQIQSIGDSPGWKSPVMYLDTSEGLINIRISRAVSNKLKKAGVTVQG